MSENQRLIFSGMNLFINNKWEKDQAVIVEHGRITAIVDKHMVTHHLPAMEHEYPADHYLVPGFIDMHIHGAGGFDVMDGTVEALEHISNTLAQEGVTGFLATTMTADSARIEAALSVIPEAVNRVKGAAILGVHLEGPFIAGEKMGAQPGAYTRLPDLELFNRWQTLSGEQIRLVTLAPELENALPFIEALRAMGVISAIGHTNATYQQTTEAISAGCHYATHLFNAMRSLHQREPGALGALLLAEEVSAEIIVDGEHLHPAICELALRMKGRERLLLVTDAMRAKCMGDGSYDLGGQSVKVTKGRAQLSDGTLAGSVLKMPEAIKNMVKFSGCKLEDAILMATANPAHRLNIASKKGSIEVGKDADMVVLNEDFKVRLTLREGEVVFNSRS